MTTKIRERDLEFDFVGAVSVERVDVQGVPIPKRMRFVDFLVEEKQRALLIEVKDPSFATATEEARQEFVTSLIGDELIHEKLVPKARDSYTLLHLMEKDSKPFLYVVVLGMKGIVDDLAFLPSFKDRLLRRLRHEAEEPWVRQYVTDCVVVTPEQWSTHFPDYALTRV